MSVRAGETIVRLRVFLAAGWVVLAVLLFLFAPGLSTLPGANVNFLIPKHTRAVKIEERSLQLFRVPLFSEIAVVQRDPEGLPATVEQATVRRAAELDGGRLAGFPSRSFAFPLSNSGTIVVGPSAPATGEHVRSLHLGRLEAAVLKTSSVG
jgi:hypothetical protein